MKEIPKEVTTRDLLRNASEITNRVAYGGEQITITRHGKPLAKLVPMNEREKEKFITGK